MSESITGKPEGNPTILNPETAGSKNIVGVHNEWNRLREVMLGDIRGNIMPQFQEDWGRYANLSEFIPGNEGMKWIDRDPENGQKMIEQIDGFEKILKSHGIKVHRPRPIPDCVRQNITTLGDAMQYARDPHLVLGRNIIQTNMRMTFRIKEHYGWTPLFRRHTEQNSGIRWVGMPDVEPTPEGTTPEQWAQDARLFVEGGDTFILGKDILVGFSSLGSSPSAALLYSFLA